MIVPTALLSSVLASTPASYAHVENQFHFELHAPMEKVAPLFAPVAERSWGDPDWKPEFIYPRPEKDIEGAVFTLQHGEHRVVWINTRFDPPHGQMQYVYFVADVQVVAIDVKVTPQGPSDTRVDVTYRRTALSPAANDLVQHLGENDRQSGPDWKHGVETALGMVKR